MSGIKVVADIPISMPPADRFDQNKYPHLHALELAANVECEHYKNPCVLYYAPPGVYV